MTRDTLRKTMLAVRDGMAPEDRRRKSGMIRENLWQLPAVRRAKTIFVYVNFRSEVETLSFIEQALAQGKDICVPFTLVKEKRLDAYPLQSIQDDLRPGSFGIPEPDPRKAAPCDPQTIDLVIVPGSVFDTHGGRLGYGGGFYDRFLQQEAPRAVRVGVAFESQVVEEVPLLPHDQRLLWLVTEKRIIEVR